MNTEQTPMKKNRWVWIIPAAIAVMIINVAIHILYMVAYSYVINPGQDASYYQAHPQVSAPYSSIIVGMPLLFLVCRWIGKKFAARFVITAALLFWLVYFLIDLTIIMFAGALSSVALLFIISFVTKFAVSISWRTRGSKAGCRSIVVSMGLIFTSHLTNNKDLQLTARQYASQAT